jgi:hypothetical protein
MLSAIFIASGFWFLLLGLRAPSSGHEPPSSSIAFAGVSKKVRGIVDQCIVPVGATFVCLGLTLIGALVAQISGTLGLAATLATVIFGVLTLLSISLTFSVYFFKRPRSLISKYMKVQGR